MGVALVGLGWLVFVVGMKQAVAVNEGRTPGAAIIYREADAKADAAHADFAKRSIPEPGNPDDFRGLPDTHWASNVKR